MSTPSETPPQSEDAPAVEGAAATEQRTAAVVYNPVKVHLPSLKRTVNRYQREAGWAETKWYATSEEDPGGGMAREAVAAGVDVIAAAGGDGTVRAVAEVAHEAGVTLALLPSGTGNLLARNIPAPIDDLGASAHTIFKGEDRAIDFGQVRVERPDGSRDQYGFLVMAGLGLDARMLVNTNDDLKKKVGWLAYVDSLVRSLRDADAFDFRFKLDDEATRSVRGHSLIVGNCGMLQAGAMLLPDAEIDDGVFDVLVMRPHSVLGWARIAARVFWENAILRWVRRSALGKTVIGEKITTKAREERPLRYLRGKQFVVRLEKPDEFEIDGDPVGEVVAFRASIDPGALTVRVAGPEDQTRATRRR
jgi:diacylglycerol kinase (ATP)